MTWIWPIPARQKQAAFRLLPDLSSMIFGLLILFSASSLAAQTGSLSQRIDEQIERTHIGPLSPLASDTDCVRRVYLDLIGTIPSVAEARSFLADTALDKRATLIDQLLASSRHAQHLSTVFDVMLMERRPDKHVPAADWRKNSMSPAWRINRMTCWFEKF